MVERCVVRESSSPYASPTVLVKKKDGKLKLCVDDRAYNAKTHKDADPLPRIHEAFDVLKRARYFCSLELDHGFNQIPVEQEDIEKTAFKTGTGGLYKYTRMPFGLCNAPAAIMHLMDKAFGDLKFQILLVYLDGTLVFGSTFAKALERLEVVLSRLTNLNLKVKTEKSQMLLKKVHYLGHLLTSEGTEPDPGKDCENAFSHKKVLTSAPVLGYPDFTRPLCWKLNDASLHRLGGSRRWCSCAVLCK